MRVLIAGASGFLGDAWASSLTDHGHQVVRLVRRDARGPDEVGWDPGTGRVDPAAVESADVVANLAGAPLVHVPWTASYRRTFLASRVDTTRTLAEAIAASTRKPAFLVQNGIAGYGDRGAEVITEQSPTDADTFMGEVTRQWQRAAEPAAEAGARVAILRTAVVLHRSGGALKTMLLPFRLGLGGRIGSGRQYFATISLSDWLGAATFLAQAEDLSGAFNLSGPDASTNAEFTEALGEALGRPTRLLVPSVALRNPLAGPIGAEMLASQRVEPARLQEAGYAFAHNDIRDRLADALR